MRKDNHSYEKQEDHGLIGAPIVPMARFVNSANLLPFIGMARTLFRQSKSFLQRKRHCFLNSHALSFGRKPGKI